MYSDCLFHACWQAFSIDVQAGFALQCIVYSILCQPRSSWSDGHVIALCRFGLVGIPMGAGAKASPECLVMETRDSAPDVDIV